MVFLQRCSGGAGCCWVVRTHLERRDKMVSCINHSCKEILTAMHFPTHWHKQSVPSELPLGWNITFKEPKSGCPCTWNADWFCFYFSVEFYTTVSPIWSLKFLMWLLVCPIKLVSLSSDSLHSKLFISHRLTSIYYFNGVSYPLPSPERIEWTKECFIWFYTQSSWIENTHEITLHSLTLFKFYVIWLSFKLSTST